MIFKDTYIYIVDNTNVSTAKCISISGNFKKKYASIGNYIVCVLKKVRSQRLKKKKMRIYRGEIHQVLLVSQVYPLQRQDGSIVNTDINAGIILSAPKIKKQKKELWTDPKGTRILLPLPVEIRLFYPKVASIAFMTY